jgi:hypothetical protein
MSVNPEDEESEQMDVRRLRADVSETRALVSELKTQVLALRNEANERLRRSVRETYRRRHYSLGNVAASMGGSTSTLGNKLGLPRAKRESVPAAAAP